MKEEARRAKLAALFGLEEHLPTEPTPDAKIEQQSVSREAEAVAAYIAQPQRFTRKKCKECGDEFATDRGNVAYCQDECRKVWLARIGITWNPKKPPSERWDFTVIAKDNGEAVSVGSTREPLTIGSQALVVADLATEVLIQQEQQISDETPESAQSPTPTVFVL